jgi:hypothetical protein
MTVKRAAALTMPRARSAVRRERMEVFTFPAFLSVALGAEEVRHRTVGVVFDLREHRFRRLGTKSCSLLRERLTDRCSRVKACIGEIHVDTIEESRLE